MPATRKQPGDPFPVVDNSVIERERNVLELRAAGYTFDRIATQLDYADKGGAYKAYGRALTRTLKQPAAEVRELEEYRLDRLLAFIWQQCVAGDLHAIQVALRVSESRRRLLGLDHSDQLAERTADLAEGQGQLVALAMMRLLAELGLDRDPTARAKAAGALRAIAADPAILDAEVVEDEEAG